MDDNPIYLKNAILHLVDKRTFHHGFPMLHHRDLCPDYEKNFLIKLFPHLHLNLHKMLAQHSTVTPLVRKVNGKYQLFLILRNNRCDDRFPGGIFHAHPEYAHIKQEGIGLIEASGLFILPARLKRQAALVEEIAKAHTPKEEYLKEHPDLEGFNDMVKALEGGMSARAYMAEVCRKILGNVAVFKDDEKGQEGLARFLRGLNA